MEHSATSPPATFVASGVQGAVFGYHIPVSSLQYQLIGKLLGGSNPTGELSGQLK